MTDDEKELWLEGAETFGDAVENRRIVPVMEEDEIDFTVSFPAVKYDRDPSVSSSAKPEAFRQVYWKTFWNKIMEGYDMVVEEIGSLSELEESTEAARDRAINAAVDAEKVDASLVNMTVTITDRNGQSKSVDIGFEMYRTYPSVAAMNADAANVPQGKFVIIATTDKTSTENAQLYCKNSEGSFTFLSDLDQASSAAWAEWMETQKPAIIQAIADAINAATLANGKAAIAQTAADNANASRMAIEANEQTRQTNEAGRVSAESARVSAWNSFFSDTLATGCRKLWNDFWSLINTSWTGFWGTSETDPNGVRKQWADLKADAQSDHTRAGQDHDVATTDHTTATSDHSVATQDHNVAVSDHSTASQDHVTATSDSATAGEDHQRAETATENANTQANRAKEWADHPPYIADGTAEHPGNLNYWYIWDDINDTYVKSPYAKGDDLHYDEMSEEEKDDLARRATEQLAFASAETCEAIIDELT